MRRSLLAIPLLLAGCVSTAQRPLGRIEPARSLAPVPSAPSSWDPSATPPPGWFARVCTATDLFADGTENGGRIATLTRANDWDGAAILLERSIPKLHEATVVLAARTFWGPGEEALALFRHGLDRMIQGSDAFIASAPDRDADLMSKANDVLSAAADDFRRAIPMLFALAEEHDLSCEPSPVAEPTPKNRRQPKGRATSP